MVDLVFDFKSKRMQINFYTKQKVLNTGTMLGSWEKDISFFHICKCTKTRKAINDRAFLRYSIGIKIFI